MSEIPDQNPMPEIKAVDLSVAREILGGIVRGALRAVHAGTDIWRGEIPDSASDHYRGAAEMIDTHLYDYPTAEADPGAIFSD